MKYKRPRPIVNTRELPPRVRQTKEGYQIGCPFCPAPHPIVPGQETLCGTTLKLTAVQTVIPVRTVRDKNLICLKCHKSEGIMVRYGTGYIHLEDCDPSIKLLTERPDFSKKAERVFRMKLGWLKRWLEKRNGIARAVSEVDDLGNETGKILGYYFQKV